MASLRYDSGRLKESSRRMSLQSSSSHIPSSSSWCQQSIHACCSLLALPITCLRRLKDISTRHQACWELLVFIIQLYVAYWVLSIVHTETYVFQCTTFADFIRPVHRATCPLISHGIPSSGDAVTKHRMRSLRSTEKEHTSNTRSTSSIGVDVTFGPANLTEKGKLKSHKLSIALVYLYDGSSTGGNGNDGAESWNEALMQRVIRNRKEYCKKHGYYMINANSLVDRSRPAAWSKLKVMDHCLHSQRENNHSNNDSSSNSNRNRNNDSNMERNIKSSIHSDNSNDSPGNTTKDDGGKSHSEIYYDYLLYIDMDVVIMDINRRLEDYISIGTQEGGNVDFIMTEDWNGPNTGIWLVRNSYRDVSSIPPSSSSSSSSSPLSPSPSPMEPSLSSGFPSWFLRTAWAQSHLMKKWSPEGLTHPFEYEQRAFHFLLDTKVWRQRGLQRYRGEISLDSIRSHFTFFPQCSFNSYSLHPLDFRGDRELSQYAMGDFLIHFAGKKGRKRILLMEHYLTLSEATYNKG